MRTRGLKWALLLVAPGLMAALAATTPDAPAPASAAPAALPKVETATFDKDVHPLIEKYCYECHGDGLSKGDLAIDKYHNVADLDKDSAKWEAVLDKVHRHEMPPDDADAQPTQQERDFLVNWVDRTIHKYDPSIPDPGRVTLHRLNRSEYTNTIRDLTGVTYQADLDFPPDDSGYGFDNIGDVLSLPPMLMEKYLNAAVKILDQAVPTDKLETRKQNYPAYLLETGFNDLGAQAGGWVHLISLEEGHVSLTQHVPAAGEYRITMEAYGEPTGGISPNGVGAAPTAPPEPEYPFMSLRLSGNQGVGETYIHQFLVDAADKDHPGQYTWEIGLPAGSIEIHEVMDRIRGGENENSITNGRVGAQQIGVGWVKSITIEGPLPGAITRWPASTLAATGTGTINAAGERYMTGNGEVSAKFTVKKEGDFFLRATAYAQQAGDEPTKMAFRINGQPTNTFDVLAPARRLQLPGDRVFSNHPASLAMQKAVPQVYEFRTHLTPGEKTFSAGLINEFADPENENPNLQRRTLTIQNIEVVDLSQPYAQPDPTPAMKQYFTQAPAPGQEEARAREILSQFAERAWRGPVAPADLDKLMKLYALAHKNNDSFEQCVKLGMTAVLVSPHFLFRGEAPETSALAAITAGPQVVKTALAKSAAAAPAATSNLGVPVDELTLATRLSYFLWSSGPDDELLGLAKQHQLRAHLAEQVKRMVASPKSQALVDNFAGQWLQFRSLSTFNPDRAVLGDDYYLAWPQLCDEMEKETGLFFDYVMRQDRSVFDFLTADYTFVNDDLANYYGMPPVTGDEFRMVSLKDSGRRGVLTQGSVLVLTSNPTRTSPVKRGKWVLENLLGTPPPPPPANVPALDDETQLTGTLRQQMEQHRANPVCASCHARMDPIGFGLENFDPAGLWRDTDKDSPIDPSGALLTGEKFNGAAELVQILADKKRTDFLRCLSEKMLTYALGRGLEYYDRVTTDQIIDQMEKGGDKFSVLLLSVINSVPFQEMRRTDALPKAAAAPTKVALAQ